MRCRSRKPTQALQDPSVHLNQQLKVGAIGVQKLWSVPKLRSACSCFLLSSVVYTCDGIQEGYMCHLQWGPVAKGWDGAISDAINEEEENFFHESL